MFQSRLDQIIAPGHALVKLAQKIDWPFLETSLAQSIRTRLSGRRCRRG